MRPKGAPRAMYDKTARARAAEAVAEAVPQVDERTWGKKNLYVCEACEGVIATVDRHDGTTPALLGCRATDGCTGMMQSQWYPPEPWAERCAASLASIAEGKVERRELLIDVPEVTHEWYRPTPRETKKLKGEVRDYVQRGGLMLRPVGAIS